MRQKKKKKIGKDFLSQTGTTKFQKTRSTREAAHAVFLAPTAHKLSDAENNKAAFHGYWQFSGQILKGARGDFRTRTQRGHRNSVWHIFNQAVSTLVSRAWTQFSVLLGCSYPYDTFTLLSFRELWTRIKDDLSSMGTGSTRAAMRKHIAISTFQTRLSHFTASSFLKSAYYDSKFSLWVLEETI